MRKENLKKIVGKPIKEQAEKEKEEEERKKLEELKKKFGEH